MTLGFYRSQAALCFRIARSLPQERLANELLRLAAEFEGQAAELNRVSCPALEAPSGMQGEADHGAEPALARGEQGSRGLKLLKDC
jgi:hypothetical protein